MKSSSNPVTDEKPKPSFKQIFAFYSITIASLSIIFTGCNAVFGEHVPPHKQRNYEACLAVHHGLGMGWIESDGKCDYMKRN